MGMIDSCKDCEKRCVGCHSICEEYLAQKAEYDKVKKSIKLRKDAIYDIESRKREAVERMRRRK